MAQQFVRFPSAFSYKKAQEVPKNAFDCLYNNFCPIVTLVATTFRHIREWCKQKNSKYKGALRVSGFYFLSKIIKKFTPEYH